MINITRNEHYEFCASLVLDGHWPERAGVKYGSISGHGNSPEFALQDLYLKLGRAMVLDTSLVKSK